MPAFLPLLGEKHKYLGKKFLMSDFYILDLPDCENLLGSQNQILRHGFIYLFIFHFDQGSKLAVVSRILQL